MDNTSTIRYVTAHNRGLQGLRWVPYGIFFFVLAAAAGGWLRWLGAFEIVLGQAALVLAASASWYIGRQYRRTYGYTKILDPWSRYAKAVLWIVAIPLIAALDWGLGATPSMMALFIAMTLVSVARRHWPVRRHYAAVAGAFVLFAFAPVIGISADVRIVSFACLLGAALITVGLGDHFVLRRLMSGQIRPPYEAAV